MVQLPLTSTEMTVYTSLIGGLGNQMFQYAAGRALALRMNTKVRLDISGFSSYRLHQGFELQRIFACSVEVASISDIDRLLGWQSHPFFRRLLARPSFAAFRRKEFVVEPHFHYWPGINSLKNDCYLSGYWQSEKYFCDAASQIRTDFTFHLPLGNRNAELASQIKQVNAVSLHVRRGDYANNPKTKAMHGLCSLDYYRAAIRQIYERVDQPYFFIFSDDMAWVQKNLKIDSPSVYVQHNFGAESYNDMRLMSMCRHHIIANSSFSWWGAWLNASLEKIVIAPRTWFVKNNNVNDLYPQGWITL